MKRIVFSFLCVVISFNGLSTQINDTIYINSGVIQSFNGSNIPFKSYNNTAVFEKSNAILSYSVTDTVTLTVINNDTVAHQLRCYGLGVSIGAIAPGNQIDLSITSQNPGTFIYYDQESYPNNKILGLAGMIVFTNSSASSFYWNLKEIDTLWVDDIINNGATSTIYNPKFFLINGNHNPDINNDPMASIVGNVGDTILIHVANTGNSTHSLHFHGYHLELVQSSEHSYHQGRIKDTFPINPMQVLTLRMVPHQPGEYPVHDHNLVAVTGANIYPNGMFLTMLIDP
jgi:FtsP/CotA-like multicopper oxidase with cupredoxin domain